MRIAVCDDDRTTREQITSFIKVQEPNAEIITFKAGEDLIQSDLDFEIFFLDIEMNELSGIDVARYIREDQEKRGKEKSIIIFGTG